MSLAESLCNCGKPIRYSHHGGQGSCNKYQVCPTYEVLFGQLEMYKTLLRHYQTSFNVLDDYFEYSNESLKDRKKVFQILETLTDNLKKVRQ